MEEKSSLSHFVLANLAASLHKNVEVSHEIVSVKRTAESEVPLVMIKAQLNCLISLLFMGHEYFRAKSPVEFSFAVAVTVELPIKT